MWILMTQPASQRIDHMLSAFNWTAAIIIASPDGAKTILEGGGGKQKTMHLIMIK